MFLFKLPTEITLKVLGYLSPNDVITFPGTSRAARVLSQDAVYWRNRFRLHFPNAFAKANTLSTECVDYKKLFIDAYLYGDIKDCCVVTLHS